MPTKPSAVKVWESVANSVPPRSTDHVLALDMIARLLPENPVDCGIGDLSAPDIAQVLVFLMDHGCDPENAFVRIWDAGSEWRAEKSSFDSRSLKMLFDTAPTGTYSFLRESILSDPAFDGSLLKPEDIDRTYIAGTLVRLLRNDEVPLDVKERILTNEELRSKPRATVLRAAEEALGIEDLEEAHSLSI